jgi:hypothetical protein
MADDDTMDTSGVTNPKRVIARREAAADPDLKKGRDMGDMPMKGDMTQAEFSKYPGTEKRKSGPPEKMLKKHRAE